MKRGSQQPTKEVLDTDPKRKWCLGATYQDEQAQISRGRDGAPLILRCKRALEARAKMLRVLNSGCLIRAVFVVSAGYEMSAPTVPADDESNSANVRKSHPRFCSNKSN
jgi:hypothetical protein